MQQTLTPIEEFTEPAIYIFGSYVPDGMPRVARSFDPFGYRSEIIEQRP